MHVFGDIDLKCSAALQDHASWKELVNSAGPDGTARREPSHRKRSNAWYTFFIPLQFLTLLVYSLILNIEAA